MDIVNPNDPAFNVIFFEAMVDYSDILNRGTTSPPYTNTIVILMRINVLYVTKAHGREEIYSDK